jgi:ABC-type branched-subunit amino acid transport system ATPase component
MLEVRDVHKSFGGIKALDGAGFRLDAPGIYGLIGPNGAGKTTLFDVICGRQVADAGEITFEDRPIGGLRPHQLARLGLARTFQECRVLADESCLDNLLFSAQNKRLAPELAQAFSRNRSRRVAATDTARRLLALVNLDGYADVPAGALSYGQRRLLEIVSNLMVHPRVLLLDEPASGVNPTLLNTLHDFILAIQRETRTLFLIVEHNMEFIMSLASRIIVMHQGRVLEEGTPAEIQANARVIEAYLG